MEIEQLLHNKILPALGLSPEGNFLVPKEGRIAKNIIIRTNEKGDVLFRCYPKVSTKSALGYGVERARFEVLTLIFLSSNGLPVPEPLVFLDGSKSQEINEWYVFAYQLLDGETLTIEDLSIEYARGAGKLLNRFIEVSELYIPIGNEPKGDIEYIKTILNNFLIRRPEYKNEIIFSNMFNHLSNDFYLKLLEQTPKGIVHGDYFFENVLSVNGSIVGVIDFGDAYYGYLLMDLVIGAMEFSMQKEEKWQMQNYEAFIKENQRWLIKANISFETFHFVLLTNCIRFTAHLCNLEQDAQDENKLKEPIDILNNPYIGRFNYFSDQSIISEMKKCYDKIVLD